MKYRYHIIIDFLSGGKRHELRHSFNSDSEVLKSSEIRNEIDKVCDPMPDDGYTVLGIYKTIND